MYIQKHLAQNLSKYDFRKEYTPKIGYALAQIMQKYVFTTYNAGVTQTQGTSGGSGSGTTNVTDDMIRAAMLDLDVANVDGDDRFMIFYPTQRSAMLNIGKYVERQTAGMEPTPIRTGKVLDVYGLPIHFTTDIVATGSGSTLYYQAVLAQKEALVFASPKMGPDITYDWIPRRKAFLLSGDVLYGASIYRVVAGDILYTL